MNKEKKKKKKEEEPDEREMIELQKEAIIRKANSGALDQKPTGSFEQRAPLERTYLTDEQVKSISRGCLVEQLKIVAEIRREEAGLPPIRFRPDPNLVKLFLGTTMANSRKEDKKYFGDGEFHGDEQSDKTKELMGKKKQLLEGLDDPEDPGWDPPIFFKNYSEEPKKPVYTKTVTKNRNGESVSRENKIFPLTWDQFGTDWTIVLFGKRRSGKTMLIRSLCGNYLRPFFPRVYVFTKSYYSGEYLKFVPMKHVIPGLLTLEDVKNTSGKLPSKVSDDGKLSGIVVLRRIIAIQKKYKQEKMAGNYNGNMKCLIIIDDCLSDGLKYKTLIDELFYEGRHLEICVIITSQDFKGVNPSCTGNTDCAVTYRSRSERDKEAVRTKFCDHFKNDEEYEDITGQALQRKWHFVAYFQDQPHVDPEYTIFAGRPTPPEPFVMGASGWWKENVNQLVSIIKEEPELAYLLTTNDWGVIGEEQFNEEMSHVPEKSRE